MTAARCFAPYVLVVVCFVANGLQLRATTYAYAQPNALVQTWEEKILRLRDAFPKHNYVSGIQQNSAILERAADDANGFVLTQYALAPVVLEPAIGQEWTIGYFRHVPRRFIRAFLRRTIVQFTLRNFGSGFYLIHRTGN